MLGTSHALYFDWVILGSTLQILLKLTIRKSGFIHTFDVATVDALLNNLLFC